jgi:hypothetical protein
MDSVLYWKAFTLVRLGKRDEARATLAELRSRFPYDRWGADADALESSSAETEFADDGGINLRTMMGSDSVKAAAKLREILERPSLPRSRRDAWWTLLKSDAPEARQLLEHLARTGGGETQPVALGAIAKFDLSLALDIYWNNAGSRARSGLINALWAANDGKRLAEIAEREPDEKTRALAIYRLVESNPAEAARLLELVKPGDIRRSIETALSSATQSPKSSLETLRLSSDPEKRRMAGFRVFQSRDPAVIPAVISIYRTEKNRDVREAIIVNLKDRRDTEALKTIGREEADLALKRKILEFLITCDEYVKEALK